MDTQPVGTVYNTSANPAPRTSLPAFRLRGHTLSLAGDLAALESCLSLERAAGANREPSEGLASPSAIPYCDFLQLRDGEGALAGVCRFLAYGPGIPVKNPLASNRFHRSPLLTALRYSRREILEMGPMVVAPGRDALRVTALLWVGMERILERRGSALLLGREQVPVAAREALSAALSTHGLPPDLETEAREEFRKTSAWALPQAGKPGPALPESLQFALVRGCCLAGEPVLAPDRSSLEVIWVALPEMLGPRPDWRT
jgi:hypothetical protein